MSDLEEIRKMVEEKKVIIGSDRTLKELKRGKKIVKVFLALNCNKDIKESIKYYGTLKKIKVVNLKINNIELGTVCRKPFSISVLCY